MQISVYMQTCAGRESVLRETLSDWAVGDWGHEPTVVHDASASPFPLLRQRIVVRRILETAVRKQVEFVLILEDDLEFNRHLRTNLSAWYPLRKTRSDRQFFASLFNPGVRFRQRVEELSYGEAEPATVHGSQAILMSYATVRYLVNCWGVEPEAHVDLRLQRLAARVCPLYYHLPSLVQHRPAVSTWGGPPGFANDFDRSWMASKVVPAVP